MTVWTNRRQVVQRGQSVFHNSSPWPSPDLGVGLLVCAGHFPDHNPCRLLDLARVQEVSEHGVDAMGMLIDVFDQDDFARKV